MLVGQNPGAEELRRGRPFVGRAGRYLDRVLRDSGLERSSLYITGVVKQATPGNREPTPAEIKYWLPVLMEEIRGVKPEIIVLMGGIAWQVPRVAGVKYIETYHPAAAMRFPEIRKKFEADIGRLRQLIGELYD